MASYVTTGIKSALPGAVGCEEPDHSGVSRAEPRGVHLAWEGERRALSVKLPDETETSRVPTEGSGR